MGLRFQTIKLALLAFVPLAFMGQIPTSAAAQKVDFNGDGRADVFLHEMFSGKLSAWLIGNSGVLQKVSYGTVPPNTGWVPIGLSDFNGDGRSDLLLRNTFSGDLAVWLIDGSRVLQAASLGTKDPNSGWTLIDIKDFNGDGRADVLWYHVKSGELDVWLIDGSRVLQVASLGTVDPNSRWTPIGTGDFNGDGRADVLWRNVKSGQLAVWLIDGSRVLQAASLGTGTVDPNSGWMPIDVKDFNGDGRADLLWRNAFSGELDVWLIDGSRVLQVASLGTVPFNSGLTLIGSGDFNGDGRADLLWRNAFSGELAVWLIDGSRVLQAASLGTVPFNSGWTLIGMDDFDGGGRTDLLWRNVFTNKTRAWLMNGSSFRAQSYSNVQPSSVWQIQIPR